MTITPEGKVSTELVNGYTEVDAETDAFVKNIQAQFSDKLNEVVAKSNVTWWSTTPKPVSSDSEPGDQPGRPVRRCLPHCPGRRHRLCERRRNPRRYPRW